MGVLPSATEPGGVWVTQLVLLEEQMIEVILFIGSDLLVTDYTSSMGLESQICFSLRGCVNSSPTLGR